MKHMQVATLCGSELVALASSMDPGPKQIQLVSEWSLAIDIILTEMKVGRTGKFDVMCHVSSHQ